MRQGGWRAGNTSRSIEWLSISRPPKSAITGNYKFIPKTSTQRLQDQDVQDDKIQGMGVGGRGHRLCLVESIANTRSRDRHSSRARSLPGLAVPAAALVELYSFA